LTFIRLHGVIPHKIEIFTTTALRTSNPATGRIFLTAVHLIVNVLPTQNNTAQKEHRRTDTSREEFETTVSVFKHSKKVPT
jgi:hypothetical protein